MHELSYNSETMRWILLELSGKNYYYVAYGFSTYNLTLNFSFWSLNSFEFRIFFLLLCFLLEWRFHTLHKACLHTRTYALTHAHTYVFSPEHTQKQTLKLTHTWKHSHLARTHSTRTDSLYLNTLALYLNTPSLDFHTLTLDSNTLALDTNTLAHSFTVALTHIHVHAGAIVSTLMYAHAHIRAYSIAHLPSRSHMHWCTRVRTHTQIKYFHLERIILTKLS